ncbi:MAG: hypothetical protein EOM91_21190 [Sphingobacteriia bacterium]|nr:hypothetical protein [Sphingobacteriia bacterium]NCC41711.1 hypothetical protein [Gammaproteobacteria bacterium]
MKHSTLLAMTLVFLVLAVVLRALSDRDVYGIVESRPADGHVGEWVIGGRLYTATAGTEIDIDAGPLDIGVCASVDLEGDRVDEIESEPAGKCP